MRAQMPGGGGGEGIGGHEDGAPAVYSAVIARCWPRIRRDCPGLHDIDGIGTNTIPMITEFTTAYESLSALNVDLHAHYAKMDDEHVFSTLDRKQLQYFRPARLVPADKLPPALHLLTALPPAVHPDAPMRSDATSPKPPPAQRKLTSIIRTTTSSA